MNMVLGVTETDGKNRTTRGKMANCPMINTGHMQCQTDNQTPEIWHNLFLLLCSVYWTHTIPHMLQKILPNILTVRYINGMADTTNYEKIMYYISW